MSILSAIGKGIATFCSAVWKGLTEIWGFIKKVVRTLLSWTVSVVGWIMELSARILAAVTAGIIVIFIWIFGDDDDLDDETPDEGNLGQKIGEKLEQPHKKIIIKGVFNKQTGQVEKETEIEATDRISSEVKQQTGGSRFAELQPE